MENDGLFTSPEEEMESFPQSSGEFPLLTDGESEISDDTLQTEAFLSVGDYNTIAVSSIPIGVLCGAIFMIVGFAYLGIVHIFKKV